MDFNNDYTFSRAEINVADQSAKPTVVATEESLHVGLFFTLAEKGIHNTLYYGSNTAITSMFGSKFILDKSSNYFTHQSIFIAQALTAPMYLVRLIPDQLNMTSYANYGIGVKYEESTNTLYIVSGSGLNVNASTIASNYTLDNDFSMYMLFKADSLGSYYNQIGFKLINSGTNDTNQTKTPLWDFTPIFLTSGVAGNPTIIRDIYGSTKPSVWLDNDVTGTTLIDRKLKTILDETYWAGTASSRTEFSVSFMSSANITDLKKRIFNNSALKTTSVDYRTIDILSGTYYDSDLNKRLAISDFKIISSANVYLDSPTELDVSKWASSSSDAVFRSLSTGVYLTSYRENDNGVLIKNPLDPNINDVDFESLISEYIITHESELSDMARYPFTHVYDSGFYKKEILIPLYSYRDIFDVCWSTRTSELAIYTDDGSGLPYRDPDTYKGLKYEDLSMAVQITSMLSGIGNESDLFNTPAMRASIYGNMGYLATSNSGYKGWCPITLKLLERRVACHTGTKIKGDFGPHPNNSLTPLFSKIDYSLSTKETKQQAWDAFLTPVYYFNQNSTFIPAFRSIYPEETSVLSNTEYVDYIIYMKKMCLSTWAKLAGSKSPIDDLLILFNKTMEENIALVFGNRVTGKVNAYQTVANEKNGACITADCHVYFAMIFKSANFNIVVHRAADASDSDSLEQLET